jgi:hypothetical protein
MGAGMNDWPATAAAETVRAWAWLYTCPLDPAVRLSRRREIASDLWEFRDDRARNESVWRLALHMLTRALLGVPDDLLWSCEQFPAHGRIPSWSAVAKCVLAIVAVSGLAVSASGPPLDPARVLRVDILSGEFDVGRAAPRLAFTLTNVGDRPTSALKANALFHTDGARPQRLGTAISWVVGWRGLAPGATSPLVWLGSQSGFSSDSSGLAPVPVPAAPGSGTPRVKLFVQHEGRWTLLGDYPLRTPTIR